MRLVLSCVRAGFLLIVTACWFVLIVGPGSAEPPPPAPAGSVELKDVKYDGLVEAVKAQRGKVVVVDAWATFCPPCMRNFPHMLEMQKKYAAEGLVCISLSVDFEKDKQKAKEFLIKQNSTIQNFWLDEPAKVWQERWDTSGPPLIFVFDRAGRRAGKFGTEDKPANPADIDKLVTELLQAKP